jgi:PhzF family phenazine biosynthesis protein
MQQVAAEMHLSDTAFAHPLSDGGEADWALRWFTPEVETNLCGHATLATAHAMYRDRGAAGTVRFASRSGVLVAYTADNGTITLDFPTAPATEVAAPDGLAEALGVPPRATFSTGALGDLIALLDDEAAVRSVTPDLGPIARIARRDGIRGTIVTAAAADPGGGYDFVPRFFAPADGTLGPHGSAHTLAPFCLSVSVATTSPACRRRPAAASCAPRPRHRVHLTGLWSSSTARSPLR